MAANGVKVMTALLTALPEKQEEFSQVLLGLRGQISAQAGCMDCVVGQDVGGPHRFLLFTVWRDLRSLEAHLASEQFRILRGAMNILSAPAEFRFVASEPFPGFP